MPLRRMQHYPIFSEHHESRAGETEAYYQQGRYVFSIILPSGSSSLERRSSTLTMLPGARVERA